MADKESSRSAWRQKHADNAVAPAWGKAAEKLRSLPVYRVAGTVFATPDPSLHQARINCLVDGKNLIMPAPSLRQGFFILPARSVPFKNISTAVTYKGLEKYGQLLKSGAIHELSISLLLTDSLVVDSKGGRIGDGKGYFDLCCALLHELGSLQQNWNAFTFTLEELISRDLLPNDPWDIKMSGMITPDRVHALEQQPQKPQIYWDMLPMDRVKRVDPLYKFFKKRQGKGLRAKDNGSGVQ